MASKHIVCPACSEKFKDSESYFAHRKSKRNKRQQVEIVCNTDHQTKSKSGVWKLNPL